MAETVAAFIKRKRKERDLTQAQLAQLAGVSRGTVIVIEKGQSEHGYSTIESVVIALHSTMEELRTSTREQLPEEERTRLKRAERDLLELYGALGGDDQHWLMETARRLFAMAEARTRAQEPAPDLPKKGRRKR
jgi:transcriptional regulator with XRE-family HTH domain